METILIVSPDDFQNTIDEHISSGFRLLMIKPADSPSEARLEKPNRKEVIKIRVDPSVSLARSQTKESSDVEWSVGRAGMMYRDLIPDRLGGKLIASQIRILNNGPVPDNVHYHKVDFQVIYCIKGAIKVVYEGQGPPFWLRTGDCVLQPPEIRHRVLEAEAGSEVIEITSPAEHETWFDHDMELPTHIGSPDQLFGNQRFALYRDEDGGRTDLEDALNDVATNIGTASQSAPEVTVLRSDGPAVDFVTKVADNEVTILIEGRGLRLKFPASF